MPIYRVEMPAMIMLSVEAADEAAVDDAAARFLFDHGLHDSLGGFDVRTSDDDGRTLADVRVYPPPINPDGTFSDDDVVTIANEDETWM